MLLGTFVPVASSSHVPASATIVSPTDGATIPARSLVVIEHVSAHDGPRQVHGYLTVDGAWHASFSVWAVRGNFSVPFEAGNVSAGEHALGAVAFTEHDAPVEAPPVLVVVDHPAVLRAVPTYDLHARALHVALAVADEGPTPPALNLSLGSRFVRASFVGDGEMVLAAPLKVGRYNATLEARDAFGQRTVVSVPFTVEDRPASLELLDATYLMGDQLRVRVRLADPDGVEGVSVLTPLGNGTLSSRNTTGVWEGTIAVAARLGEHHGSIVARDPYGGNVSIPFSFEIGGERETLFERTITTDIGAYSSSDVVRLPRIHEGDIEICIRACGASPTLEEVGVSVVAAVFEGSTSGTPRWCDRTGFTRTVDCSFDTAAPGGWDLVYDWQQAGAVTVTLRVSGIRV